MPILIILTLGTIDISQYITSSQCVTNACREGARFATKAKTNSRDEVEKVVGDYLAATYPRFAEKIDEIVNVGVFDEDGVLLNNGDFEEIESGAQIEVVVKFDFGAIRWMPGPKYAANNAFTSSTVCRKE